MKSLELFSGAGGLAIGTARAGFEHVAVIDFDQDACDTMQLNKCRGIKPTTEWNIIRANIRDFNFSTFADDNVAFIAGGVPCQPFSLGGKHRGHEDERDMFPYFIRAVQMLQPKAFLIENVKGLLRQSFADYFDNDGHVFRGGSWAYFCFFCRSGSRVDLFRLSTSGSSTGFRVVMRVQ